MRGESRVVNGVLFGAHADTVNKAKSPATFFVVAGIALFIAGTPACAQVDKAQVAQMCRTKANQYTANSQSGAQMAAACIYWCAYSATGENQYQRLYQQAQADANGLCTAGQGNCNEIKKQAFQ